jgi:hypothetical protein
MLQQQNNIDSISVDNEKLQEKQHKLPFTQVETIHPAIDYKGDDMVLGFNVLTETKKGIAKRPVYIIKESNRYAFPYNPTDMKLSGNRYLVESTSGLPLINERWDACLAQNFVDSPTYSKDFYRSIKESLYDYVDLPHRSHYDLVGLWITSTYFAHLFYAVPYLHLYGPKGSGKTKALEILNYLSFNSHKLSTITEAAIGDTISDQRGVVAIDQAERIKPDLVGLLADGYKRNGGRRRIVQGTGANREIRECSTYGHKALASYKPLHHDLSDRCIRIKMAKTSRDDISDMNGHEECWPKHRDQLYRFALMCWPDVKKYYHGLSSDGTRTGELWKSLNSVALTLELPKYEIKLIKSAFDTCVGNAVSSLDAKEEAFLIALGKKANETKSKFELKTSGIKELMKDELDDGNIPSAQWIGQKISLFGLVEEGDSKPKTRKKHVHYTFKPDHVKDIVGRYFDLNNI